MESVENYKSGFVGLVGPTNSGKSTLMNALVGKKLSIVSAKQQTTYHGVRGIVSGPTEQMIFIDTPGFQRHPEPVARLLNKVADRNAKDCDLLVWVFDASNARVLDQIDKMKEKVSSLRAKSQSVCVLNKVDKIAKESLLPMIQMISNLGIFSDIIPMSAKKGDGIERLRGILTPQLPEGVALYPKEMSTDRSQDFLITEFIREKVYEVTQQELPYSVWIEMEHWQQDLESGKCPTMRANLHVDSDSRKAILIGRGGNMLKEIGVRARKEIEILLGHQICLKLHVDVQPGWKDDANLVNRYLELDG